MQKEAQESYLDRPVCNELLFSSAVYDLLRQIPQLLARNLVQLEEQCIEVQCEQQRQQVLQQFVESNNEKHKSETLSGIERPTNNN